MYTKVLHSLDIIGHGLGAILPWDDLDPTSVSFNIPSAVILYVTPHCRSLIVTVAIPLVIAAMPKIIS